jgi:hypothetical protein
MKHSGQQFKFELLAFFILKGFKMANRALPSAYNTFIPNAKASGNLFVDFSRNINDFAVLKYCQPIPVQNTLGIWYQMGLEERARILDSDLAKYRWADGTARPQPHDVSEYFSENTFRTQRKSYADQVGKMTTEQAVWDEIDRRTRSLAQKAMTARTIAIVKTMTDATQYAATHVSDLSLAGAINGVVGNWAASTSARMTIRRTLNHVKNQITLDTRAAVNSDDLLIVMSPDTAELVSVTQEIVELVKQNPGAIQYLDADGKYPKDTYGLPKRLYNTEVLIEKTVQVTSQRGAITSTASYVLPKGTVIICHKPGSLEGVEGGRSFSTCTIHIYRDDDMKVETDYVAWDRLTNIAVTDNWDVNMTAPVTGYLLQNVV